MNKQRFLLPSVLLVSLLGFLFCVFSPLVFAQAQATAPPVARQDNVKDLIHGVEIVDPYRWLEDGDSAETKNWVTAENAYMHSLLDGLPMLPGIHKRTEEMLKHDFVSGSFQEGGYYFFYKRSADQDLWSIYRRKASGGPDELLLDPHPMSPDHTTAVAIRRVSFDGSLLMYSLRRGGEDETELHVFDVNKRRDLPDVMPRAIYTYADWKRDKSGFYYGIRQRNIEPRLYFHALGTDPAKDTVIFANGYQPDIWLTPFASYDGRYLFAIAWHGWSKSEIYFKNLAQDGKFVPLITGIDATFYMQFSGPDSIIVRTDWKAPNCRVLKIDLRHPEQEKWQEIVPETKDAMQSASVIGGRVFVNYLHNVTTRIQVFSLQGKPEGEVELPSLGSASLDGRWDQDEGLLDFSSFTTPGAIYRYSAATGKRNLWFQSPIPIQPDRFQVEQVWYSSKDGTRIPMFLVRRKDIKPDGHLPVLLYGYGGFNTSLTPDFSVIAAWWAEQGGVYAVPNLRGGGEFGQAWHKAGMLEHKQNVFDDFIAAAEWLIKNKYTTPEKLAIWGGSNGGLLVGAVTTQRPDLFHAVICEHPDLDIVRYPKLTKHNSPASMLEYGNADDPEQFKFVYAYSPYQHVTAGTKYPAMLFTSGDEDTRVPPEQARKMAARVQAASNSGLPVMLMYDVKAGHSGGRPASQVIDELALELSFLAWQLDMNSGAAAATAQGAGASRQ
jgi:prolyl oligopeptidase